MTPLLYSPIAQCAACDNPDAAPYDKRWLVVDSSGCWLTQKKYPKLAEISATLTFGYLAIRAPGMLRLDIPLDVIEDDDSVRRQASVGTQLIDVVDEGDLVGAWMSNFLGVPARLVKVHPDTPAVLWPDL